MEPLDALKKAFTLNLIDQFKHFVSDSMDEGHHKEYDDHWEFIKDSLETFMSIHD